MSEKKEEKEEVSKELFDSVCDAVGQRGRPSVWRLQVEIREKMETRILALVSYRAFLLTPRLPSKVEHTFSFLDIQGISSNKLNQVVLVYDRGQWTLLGSVEQLDQVLVYIGTSLTQICPTGPALKVLRKLSLTPPERGLALQASWDQQPPPDPGPCGGFSHQYWCVCDQLALPYREEVQWDVDTIYLTHDTRELNLLDFIHLENRDLVAIVGVLQYNQWFTKLSTKDSKLSTDVWEQILRVIARSGCLEELLLDNAGLKSDFAIKLAGALFHNPACSLHTLSLANNTLEDKGVCALSAQLAKLPLGLKHLNLSKNSLSAKGVNTLCMALCANPAASLTLTHLDLSANTLRGDELPNLHNFLSQPNCLETLDLSSSDCALEQVCASLLKGSLKHLKVLNMSKTAFSHRRSKEVPPSFKQFFSSAQALKSVNLSGTRLPLEALKSLLLGLGCNPNLSEVSLDLSCCELRSAGSQILEGCIAEIPNITSLDISDNGLDSDLGTLLVWLARNRSIQHLALGKNFSNIKSKNVSLVLDGLVHMIQEEESPLTSLSLADSRLKAELSVVLNALGGNSSLTRLDVSGNAMGDLGAKMLAKALQINTKLRTLIWDRNNISPQGLQDVAAALEKNFTIRFMPIPIVDAAQALKTSPEKTEDALMKIEQFLLRNHETRRYLQEQAYRLQQGVVATTTQQLVDRMCVKVQDHLNSLCCSSDQEVQEAVSSAQSLLRDAHSCKTLLPNLYHLRGPGVPGPCSGVIQDTLQVMAGELALVVDQQLQVLLSCMVDTAEGVCPHVMRRRSLREELEEACGGRMEVPHSFITSTLLEQSGVDIINKISEVKLSLASLLSDRIADDILDSLSVCQHNLADHVTRRYKPLLQQAPPLLQQAPPILQQAPPLETEVLDETVLDHHDDHREDRSLMNPRSKRKSILVRMLRPISVAFEMEFDLDKALEEVPIHVEDPLPPPPPPPPQPQRDSRFYSDLPAPPPPAQLRPPGPPAPPPRPLTLPSAEIKLTHHTKSRPKPRNRTKPSRRPLRAPSSSSSLGPQDPEPNGILGKLDHGFEGFFYRTVSKRGSQEVTDRKKESRKSGLLQLLKSRTSSSSSITPPPSTSSPSSSITPPPSSPSITPPPSTSSPSITPPPPTTSPSSSITPPPSTTVVTVTTEEETGGELRIKETPAESEPPGTASPGSPTEEEVHRPALHHLGVPLLGLDLLAEMKARQEKKAAAQKLASSGSRDAHTADLSEGGLPEPPPRSKGQALSPRPPRPPPGPRMCGPSPPVPSSTGPGEERSNKEPLPAPPPAPLPAPPPAPLPAPRLKRAPSEQDGEEACRSPQGAESPVRELLGDGGAFDSPAEVLARGGRQWSSLKASSAPSEDQARLRTKSLPNHAGRSSGSEPEPAAQRPVECEEDSNDDEEPSV